MFLAGAPPSATSSDRAMRVQCLCLLSGGEVHCGSPQAGVEVGREALELSRKLNNEWTLVHSIADLTQELLDVGAYEEALRNTCEGVEIGRTLPIPTLFLFTLTALGNAYQALLTLQEAREAYEEALVVAEVPYLRSLAVLSRWEGETAIECLLEAKALAEEIGLPGELWQIQAEIGELRAERGEGREAQQAFLKAAEIAQSLAQKITGRTLREGFLSASKVQRVLELR